MRIESLLKQLIGFATVSEDQEANYEALVWMKKQLSDLPLHVREHYYEGFPSLVLTTKKTKAPKLWLSAHLDVVPGSSDVFIPETQGGRLYGRGAYDMKFAIAAYMELLLDIGSALPHYDLGVMLTSDEEIGGRNGVRSLLFEEGYRGELCFMPDGGEDWKFETSAKGVLLYAITSQGRAAHGARPWSGRDANMQLARFLAAAREKFSAMEDDDPNINPFPTMTVGLMQGGEVPNQVPEIAEATIDIRFPADISRKQVRAFLDEAKKGVPGIHIRELRHSSPYVNDITDDAHQTFAEIVKAARGRRPGHIISHGSSDARHFRNLDIPVILIRPRGGGAHSEKEWIRLDDFHTYYHALRQFVDRVALDKPADA